MSSNPAEMYTSTPGQSYTKRVGSSDYLFQRITVVTRHLTLSLKCFQALLDDPISTLFEALWGLKKAGKTGKYKFDPDLMETPNTIKASILCTYVVLQSRSLYIIHVSKTNVSFTGRLNFSLLLFPLCLSLSSRSSWSKCQEGNGVSRSCTRKPKTAPV